MAVYRIASCVLVSLAALTACTSPVQVPVAEHAADPVCAQVVLSLPDELGDQPRRRTSSQATAAWGTPPEAIVLRCGVPTPPPTTDPCVNLSLPDGTSIDWIAVEDSATGGWTFTTYGRDPAVEVELPPGQPSSVLLDIARAVSHSPAHRQCL